jgi:hypothetical protein
VSAGRGRRIGNLVRLKRIIWTDDLPKARSGRIARNLSREPRTSWSSWCREGDRPPERKANPERVSPITSEGKEQAMAETQSKTEGDFAQVADHIRELNERIIASSKQAGEATLGAYAKMLQSIAELEEKAGNASPVDWLTTFATTQANFTRDLAEALTAAAHKLVE